MTHTSALICAASLGRSKSRNSREFVEPHGVRLECLCFRVLAAMGENPWALKVFVFDAPKAGGSGNEAASEKNYSFLLDDALLIRCAFYRYACCADACRHWSLQEYLSVVRFQLHPCFKTDPKLR